ncbi:F-box domain-containing protein [Mycena venus]|uniref:F-box domain-containing protein n=1 Tax=Mycena venus TaxID=2733690 RepID=A0A8H7CD91_9AGAR|nr:F-box domain-containing protein [Mycena venus]
MLLSFLRSLVCLPSSYADYDPLGTIESLPWPTASFPRPLGPITRLPPELVHLIISCVDSTMLATCSLVCSRWNAPARARMFSRLSISMSNADRFGRLFVPPSRVTFGSHVREIELDDSILGDFWASHVLPRFVADFPHLSTLTLFGTVPASPFLPSAFEVVTHLEFNCVSNSRLATSPDRLASFISTFPRLERLKLTQENGPYVNFRGLSASSIRPPPNLHRVDLDNPVLLPWITSATPQACHRGYPPRYLACSLRHLSTSLHTLELILSDPDVGESFLKQNHLDVTTQLHTLRIQADHSQAAQILLKILSYIDTSCLHEISLDFAIPYLDSPVLTLLPWSALDAALAALPSLRRLMVVKVLVSPQGWRSRINQRMVLLDAVHSMPLCRDFGFGVGLGAADLNSRPPSRAAGSRRYLTDLHTF